MKNGIMQRIKRIFMSEAHAAIDKHTDPKKALLATEESMNESVKGAQDAIMATVEVLRDMELSYAQDSERLERINSRIPSVQNDITKLRAQGNETKAVELEGILREIIVEQIRMEKSLPLSAKSITKQKETIATLRQNLAELTDKQQSFTAKRQELIAREATVNANAAARKALDSVGGINLDATSVFERQIREQEAVEAARKEMSSSSIDREFALLEESMQADKRMKGLTA